MFAIDGVRIGPVTCYESIFPAVVRDQVRAGAASRQHLAFSQLRAVESGRWSCTPGSLGISAVVAPDGSVRQRT
ncbi:MAG: nitrilase-related carbon-nitrogen hydrolase [Egibacteraceae bacterium]